MYRLASELAQPFPVLLLLAVVALAVLVRRQRLAWQQALPMALVLGALALLSTPAAAHLATGSLEWQHPPDPALPVDVEAIVVLGGGVRESVGGAEPTLAEDSVVRCLHAARLYHAGVRRPILVSGGNASGDPDPLIAPLMADLLRLAGVAAEDILIEDRSRNTYENARESAQILHRRGWTRVALVTEATHLPRAVRCFRAQGLQVVPSGCNYRVGAFEPELGTWVPGAAGAFRVQRAAHEWLGMLWYWLNGRFDPAAAPG